MHDFTPQLLPRLREQRLAGLELDSDFIYPDYTGTTLANLPAGICTWLDVPTLGGLPPLAPAWMEALGASPQVDHVVLLLVDGLGLDWFQHALEQGAGPGWASVMKEAVLTPLTSIVPSTTTSALTTLWTGVPTAQHGITGYEMWLKEYGMVSNMIALSPTAFRGESGALRRAGVQPEAFLPVPTLGPHLKAHGVQVQAVMHQSLAHSALSSMHLREVKVVPYLTQSDLWVTLAAQALAPPAARTYTYIYFGNVDELEHRFGPEDERVQLEFEMFGLMLERFLARRVRGSSGKTLFLITADHGHMGTPRSASFELRRHAGLSDCLSMKPSGENRLAYLYLRPGREEQLRQYVARTWPGQFSLLPAAQALESGLFGPPPHHPAIAERLGDLILFSHGSAYWWWADHDNGMLGRHGGLTPTEMLVPLIGLVI